MVLRVLIVFLLTGATLGAQTVDSLWRITKDKHAPFEERIKSLHRLTQYYLYNNPDSSLYYAQLEQDLAIEYNDSTWIGHALNAQGKAMAVKSDFAGALDKFSRMLEIQLAIQDTVGIANAYNNMGNIYYYRGDFDRALDHYIKSLHYELLRKNDEGLATSYINIGSIYALQKEYRHALQYFKRAVPIYEKNNQTGGMGSCYSNIGNIYKSLDSLDLALDYFQRSLPLLKENRDNYGLGVVYLNLAAISDALGDRAQAYTFLDKSEEIRKSLGDQLGFASTLTSRGDVFIHDGRYQDARDACKTALSMAASAGAMQEMENACDCLYQAFKGLHDNEMALKYYEHKNTLHDSIAAQDTRRDLQLMEFHKQVARDSMSRVEEKQELEALHARELRQETIRRNLLGLAGIVLLALAVILVLNTRRMRKRTAVIAAEKSRSDELLINILPPEIAKELKEKGQVEAREFDQVTVLFTDFIGFSSLSQQIPPQEMVDELDLIFREFDAIADRHGIQKIKSIGDGYMAAGGLPVTSPESVENTVLAALEMQNFVAEHNKHLEAIGKQPIHMRAGLHTGSIIAGIVGFRNFQFDIWGDTVNIASRMEQASAPGHVNISRSVYQLLKDNDTFIFTERGPIDAKGVGDVEMWFVGLAG